MNYTLHQLQIFLEVVKQQSVTRAAEEMHMTQPALSIQLKNFQFRRREPNPYGNFIENLTELMISLF